MSKRRLYSQSIQARDSGQTELPIGLLDVAGMATPMMLSSLLGDPFSPTEAMAGEEEELAKYRAQHGKNVLSLFDGLGATRVALEELGVPINNYYSSEIDPYPKKVLSKNYPDAIDLGDVKQIKGKDVGNVDLMCGGSPCQDLSRGNTKGKGLEGDRSSLFWEYARLRDETKPTNFLFENVIPRGSLQDKDVTTIRNVLGVDPVVVDAKDFSGMARPRMFFTDLPVDEIEPVSRPFADYLDAVPNPRYRLSDREVDYMERPAGKSGRTHFERHGFDASRPHARTIPSVLYKGVPYNAVKMPDGSMKKLSPNEVERLFGLPEDYTDGVSNTRRYKMLGNSMSVPVLKHLFKGLLK